MIVNNNINNNSSNSKITTKVIPSNSSRPSQASQPSSSSSSSSSSPSTTTKTKTTTTTKTQLTVSEVENIFRNSKTKEDIIRILNKNRTCLNKITLPAPNVVIEQAHKDFLREKVLFNEVPFIPDKYDWNRSQAFSKSLRLYLKRLLHVSNSTSERGLGLDLTPDTIADITMQRACRTSAGADSFFMVQRLLCVDGTFVTQRTGIDDPPIKIDLYLVDEQKQREEIITDIEHNYEDVIDIKKYHQDINSNNSNNHNNDIVRDTSSTISSVTFNSDNNADNNNQRHTSRCSLPLCARSEIRNTFAVYDTLAMDELSGNGDPSNWLEIESVVIDETNFQTGAHNRILQLFVTYDSSINSSSLFSNIFHS